jgi:hypothetical protein
VGGFGFLRHAAGGAVRCLKALLDGVAGDLESHVGQERLNVVDERAGASGAPQVRRRLAPEFGRGGEVCKSPLRQRRGDSWEIFERRRLAWPLKNRRVTWGMRQTELGELVGVSRDSIQRWELARVPPRPVVLVVLGS